jgi:glycosyltransferase involved in cell wall biosynthesis
MKLSEEKNIPYVITEHSTIYALGAKKIKGQIKKDICLSYKNASSVICVSQALQNLIRPYCNNSIVIGNVIDCNLFHNEPKIRDKNNFTFLTVCYMKNSKQLKKKGIDILVKAFQKVIMVYPNVRLNIGGDGAGVKYLKKWILEEGIDKNVNLLGELSRSQVSKEMQNSDVFVLPSRYETFGVVYAEAMASGKPVIATRTGGPDSFVDEKTGFLIDVENEEQLKDAMINIIEKFECYNPFYIRNKILGQFSMDAIGTKLTNLYNKINGEN